MKFCSAFEESAEEAASRGKMLHPDYLSYLALIVRNDVVHHHSHVSRRAYQCLITYLSRYPYAVFVPAERSAGDADSESQMYPSVVICAEAAWLPFFRDCGGFFRKSMMKQDMSVAGQEYGQKEYGMHLSVPSQRTQRTQSSGAMRRPSICPSPDQWDNATELLLGLTNRALDSGENDWNGDLLLFDYLVKVARQDLDARLQVIDQICAGIDFTADSDMISSVPVKAMLSMLQNSALWRMSLDGIGGFHAKLMKQMVHGLVQLVVNVSGGDDDEVPTQELDLSHEGEDDSPAGASAFSKAGLSCLASSLLGGLLDLYGAMERLGGFYALGSHRAAPTNYRMALDEFLVDSFWTEHGFCGEKEEASAFIFSLKPRDALRFIGFVVADKLSKTYGKDGAYVRSHYTESLSAVQPLFDAMHTMEVGSKDVPTFFEIGMDAVLAGIVMDINRTVRMFKSADHVCLLVGAIASSLDVMILEGEPVPIGTMDAEGIKAAIKNAVDVIYDNEAATNSASRVGNFGSMCLSMATIFVNSK